MKRLAALLVVMLLLVPAVAAKSLLRFEPDDIEGAPPRRGEHWIQEGPQVSMLLSRMETDVRREWLREQTGLTVDPFHSPEGAERRYLTFLVVIENRGEVPVTFNPMKAWLSTGKGPVHSPMGISDLSFDYRALGGEMPPAYEKVSVLVLDNPIDIAPGSARSGMLVYSPVDMTNKHFTVDVVVDVGPETIKMTAPYKRVKIKLDDDGNPIETAKRED